MGLIHHAALLFPSGLAKAPETHQWESWLGLVAHTSIPAPRRQGLVDFCGLKASLVYITSGLTRETN